MTFHYNEARQLLERSPRSLQSLLSGLDTAWIEAKESEAMWDARQVMMHLLFAETLHWPARVQTAISDNGPHTFAAFDASQQFSMFAGHTMDQLLEEFCAKRTENLALLDSLNLQETDFKRTALHPSLGVVELKNVIASWTAHDLAHLVQVSRTFVREYQQAVGPWAQNMSLLRNR